MSRRRKNKRSSSSIFREGVDPFEALRRHLSLESGDDERDDFFEDDSSTSRSKLADLPGLERLEIWQDFLSNLRKQHPSLTILKWRKQRLDVRIREFNLEGRVSSSTNGESKRHKQELYFDYFSHTFNCECSCEGPRLCEHTYALTHHLLLEIQDENGPIFQKIAGEDYFEEIRLRQRDSTKLFIQDAIDARLQRPQSMSLDEEEPEPAVRISWNLTVESSYNSRTLKIVPVIHSERKRGGWTKGRQVNIDEFLELPIANLSPLDREMLDAIVRPTGYYDRKPAYFEWEKAFRALAGSDAVMLEKTRATVQIADLEFRVTEHDDQYTISSCLADHPRASDEDHGRYKFSGGRVVLDPEKQLAFVYFGSNSDFELAEHIDTARPTFGKDEKAELLEQIQPLQEHFSVQLPEDFIDEVIHHPTEIVLLLQLQKTGALDITICARNPAGKLVLPGTGLSRQTDTEDGKLKQTVRDLPEERQRARELAGRMNLTRFAPLADFRYRIDDQDRIFEFLGEVGDLVTQELISVVWHKATADRFDVLGRLTPQNVQVRIERKRDWFGLDGTCRIGNEEIPLKELLGGLRGTLQHGLLEVQPGKWAQITEELRKSLQRLADVSTESRGSLRLDDSAALTISALEDAQVQFEADKAWQKTIKRVREAKDISPDPPVSLDCELRDYQIDGFRWMCRLAEWGVGGILADDMGLGKTVQTLAMLLQRVESGPTLVIAPTSLGFNWEQETRRFAPSLNPILFRESDREELIKNASEGDVIICSYGLALREGKLLSSIKWGTLVLDEAQNIKNANSKTAKEIKKFKADWKIALTGTPIENHLGELWSIFQAVAPGVLGGWEQFRKRFASPIEKDHDLERREALAHVISPFVLRREKSDVLKDLPELDETNLFVELSKEERKRYDEMRLAAITELDELSTEEFSNDQRFRVLQILTRLRQLSCHIGLVDEKWTGSSAKLDLLAERLVQLKERGHRPLIFSQFTSHLALIRQMCEANDISFLYLDGQTTPKQRQDRVEKFQNGDGDAFLISLKAGGTGLNLTAADYVIHMDPWWNPAVEDQATDRAHRIGQTKNVMVYRIIAKDTIEEQIIKLHEDKRDLVEGVLAGSEAAGKLSTEQLAEMIRSGGEPVPNSK